MNPSLIRKLEGLIERHEEVQAMLGEPDVVSIRAPSRLDP